MNLHTGIELVPGYFAFVTGLSILFAGGLFAGCFRRVRSISSQQRRRLGDITVEDLARVDLEDRRGRGADARGGAGRRHG